MATRGLWGPPTGHIGDISKYIHDPGAAALIIKTHLYNYIHMYAYLPNYTQQISMIGRDDTI